MKQYDIRWAMLPPPIGRRPVLLLSRSPAYRYLSRAIVVEITTRIREIPQEVRLGRAEGLRSRCAANFDNLHVVALSQVGALIGSLPASRVSEAKKALGYALDWAELKLLT